MVKENTWWPLSQGAPQHGIFLNRVCFALRSGGEHRQLRHGSDSQIKVVERDGERAYLEYVEDSLKNISGASCKKNQTKKSHPAWEYGRSI